MRLLSLVVTRRAPLEGTSISSISSRQTVTTTAAVALMMTDDVAVATATKPQLQYCEA
jgi:hypothetical protein